MRRLIIGLALASTAALSAPAAAQYQNNDPYYSRSQPGTSDYGAYGRGQNQQIRQRILQLRERVARVTQRGAVSRDEGYRLRYQLGLIEQRYNQFARNGISANEQYDLQQRIQNLQSQIREDRRNGRAYGNERGYDDDRRYGNDRRYDDDRRYDRRDDDDRRYDRRDRDDDDD